MMRESFHEISDVDENQHGIDGLGFDPDKLIEPETPFRDESYLSSPELVCYRVEGLGQTGQETRMLENGNSLFDSPVETGERLNSCQGEAVPNFKGDCGLVSCQNVALLAGKEITEADVVSLASRMGLCSEGGDAPEDNGATSWLSIAEVLHAIGIAPSFIAGSSSEEIAGVVESGRGVIACVEISEFWDVPFEGKHAVTIISVERDPDGNAIAFYVCDSGTGGEDSARRVDSENMLNSLSDDPLVISRDIIR